MLIAHHFRDRLFVRAIKPKIILDLVLAPAALAGLGPPLRG
jgi:hypothetical protein